MMEHQLVGIITGASDGIGRSTALRLAKENHKLALLARRQEKLEEVAALVQELGGEALVIPTDITVKEQRDNAVRDIVDRWGRVDYVVHSAGVFFEKPYEEVSDKEEDGVMRLNLEAPMKLTKAVIPFLRKSRGTNVIVSSMAAEEFYPEEEIYVTTKAAVNGFTRSLRASNKGRFEAYALMPGSVDTLLLRKVLDPIKEEMEELFKEKRDKGEDAPASLQDYYKRILTPEQVAEKAAWLVLKQPNSPDGLVRMPAYKF